MSRMSNLLDYTTVPPFRGCAVKVFRIFLRNSRNREASVDLPICRGGGFGLLEPLGNIQADKDQD